MYHAGNFPVWVLTAAVLSLDVAATEPVELTGDTASDIAAFGWALAQDDGILAVSAPTDSDGEGVYGSVFLYQRVNNEWLLEQRLLPSKPNFLGNFGNDIDLDSGTLVAAEFKGEGAFVFERNDIAWNETSFLASPDTLGVAIQNDVIAVGSVSDSTLANGAGAVKIFRKTGDSWQESQTLFPSDAVIDGAFGHSISISGEILVVGAPGPKSEAAYVFRSTESGFVEEAKIYSSTVVPGDAFGSNVHTDGSTIAVGVSTSSACSARAYVFEKAVNLWIETGSLLPGGLFACESVSVSVEGNNLLVGTPSVDSVTWFRREAGGWTGFAPLESPEAQTGQRFGFSASLFWPFSIIGSPFKDEGTAYIFDLESIFTDAFGG